MMQTLLSRYFISLPPDQKIILQWDIKQKVFFLSAIIFYAERALPRSILDYVNARQGKRFQPHETMFTLKNLHEVELVQRFPFLGSHPLTLRQHARSFWHMVQKCRQMLTDIAREEVYHKNAVTID